MKKSWTTLLTLVLSITLLAGCGGNGNANNDNNSASEGGSESSQDKKRIALIHPEKVGVNPFFALMDEGLKKAAGEFDIEVKSIESTDPASIEQNLRTAVAENYDLIITSTFQMEDALNKIAPENPNVSFAIIDTTVDLPNVRSVVFREHEAAYLLGAAAGLATQSNVVGNVVAADIPIMHKYMTGFEEGAKSVNPDVEILVNFVGGFDDPAKAKELAILQHSKGADFVAGMSAVGDLGVFEAAKENGFYTSGQDTDNTGIDPEHVVLAQLKGADAVVYETVKDFVEGNFTFDVRDYGLKESGVGLTYVTHESETPLNPFIGQEIVDQLKVISEEIVNGNIKVTNALEQN
ncbi:MULTISPECIES: BMP family protein [Paenibacillus]|uniref:BMP family ABC transporter substrate-binding protein n=1 Tax=Paenibacillus campinasensis TaxID=66347 RepID=A0A268ETH6_9BACL|nr:MULTISPECIES: BMP family protein [Paenibacillus]MUG67136.1 BMP family ABC transporter substrate-binding protein [Paenibacillus campinasensis]PAD76437.1 BMP family ABC transporter substrate-binding protein [Paenibacillus campinasensis]PAK54978.1 BMP family ABC transporter substrate-binding protein [Paenibacillus sp. 7541]